MWNLTNSCSVFPSSMWTQHSSRWWATTRGSWLGKNWLNSPRATRTELTCWIPSTPASKKEKSVSRPSLPHTSLQTWDQNNCLTVLSPPGMAGHLLCQKEVRRQHTAACEDNARHWARRVSQAAEDPCVFKQMGLSDVPFFQQEDSSLCSH